MNINGRRLDGFILITVWNKIRGNKFSTMLITNQPVLLHTLLD